MATSIRVEMNTRGAIDILQSSGVMADLLDRADRVASAAGPGHEILSVTGKTRARVTVITVSHAARRAESEDRNLTRALDAARG